MPHAYDYDVLVLGAGPGGYVGAIRAAQLGMKAAVLEKDRLGGVCLNIGCIPSKALIHLAEQYHSLSQWEKMGVKIDRQQFDYSKVYKQSRQAAQRLCKGIEFLLKKNQVEAIMAAGKISGAHEITTSEGRKLTAQNILIATGSRSRELAGFPYDETDILSSSGALLLEKLPARILILGAGAIGCEFAHIMNGFGVEVHLVEALPQILPLEDPEIVEVVARAFKKRKIKIATATKAVSAERQEGMFQVVLRHDDGKESAIAVDKILVAVGRVANSEDLGLESVGISCEKGFINVGDYYQTEVPGIFAVGDVIASPLLAHVASKEAEIAVEYMAGRKPAPRIDPLAIPAAVYCEPQVASFGYNEPLARERGIAYEKVTFPYKGAGKAIAIDRSDGLAKVLFDPKTKEILGGHVVGADATELIHELLLAKTAELLPLDIADMIHAHPTLSEVLLETMRAVEGRAIHF